MQGWLMLPSVTSTVHERNMSYCKPLDLEVLSLIPPHWYRNAT